MLKNIKNYQPSLLGLWLTGLATTTFGAITVQHILLLSFILLSFLWWTNSQITTTFVLQTLFIGNLNLLLVIGNKLLGAATQETILSLNWGLNFHGASIFTITFIIDRVSLNLTFLTTALLFILVLYSYNYMKNDKNLFLFIILIEFFALSMLLLLLAGNVFTIMLGWEAIGLASFLLINFWSNKVYTLKSALKALFFNKISDSLILGFLVLSISANWTTTTLSPDIWTASIGHIGLLPITLLLLCTFCKSVQFIFHVWLPDSMEAPIPASALIHSATLVSAGVYLCYRFNNYLYLSYPNLFYYFIFTAFYGALISCSQTDLKKILAYSTISHCGYMFIPAFLGDLQTLLLYFYVHGLTKAVGFLLVGVVIQDLGVYQDSRKTTIPNPRSSFPLYLLPLILMNLAGLPFVFGFLSKSLLFNLVSQLNSPFITYYLLDLSSLFAVLYSYNVSVFIFVNKNATIDQTPNMNLPTRILGLLPLLVITLILLISMYFPLPLTQHTSTGYYKPTLIWIYLLYNLITQLGVYLYSKNITRDLVVLISLHSIVFF